MRKKQITKDLFVEYIKGVSKELTTELIYNNGYELFVAVVLSAQCTDKRVNSITPNFFKRFPTVYDLSKAYREEVFELIKSCSYPNSKTDYLINSSRIIAEEFNGVIPDNIDDLMKLPGVGRKTANVIMSVLYNKPAMPVDTHVARVSKRIGLVGIKDNIRTIEKKLQRLLPEELLNKTHHWLVLHGRYICKSRKPNCINCKINQICVYYNNKTKL